MIDQSSDDPTPDALNLGARLDAASRHVEATPAWADLTARIETRHRRRSRLMAGAATAAVIAGSLSGYAWGSQNREDTVRMRVDGPSSQDENPSDATDDGQDSNNATTLDELEPDGLVFRRDFAPQSQLRVRLSPFPATQPTINDTRRIECQEATSVMVSLSDPEMVASLRGSIPPDRSAAVSRLDVASGSDGRSFAVVVVTGAGNSRVRVTFPDGSDEMKAVDGLAVLAATVDNANLGELRTVRVSIGDAPPTEVDSAMVRPAATETSAVSVGPSIAPPLYERQLDCSIPLPPPGEQPADPSAQRQALVAAMSSVVDGSVPFAEKATFIDDPTGLEDVLERARTAFPLEVNGARFELVDLVFTAPDRASIKFNVRFPPESMYSAAGLGQSLIGQATRVDGRWLASRESVCTLMAITGTRCA